MNQQKIYYQKRAKEYERVYQKTERQEDLKTLHTYLQEQATDKNILEIACGTGYWTKTLATTSHQIQASDYNKAVLEIAKTKSYGTTPVFFQQLDFWKLPSSNISYDLIFGGFIWSHILKDQLPSFIKLLQGQIQKEGALLFIDNQYVEGSSTPISRIDQNGNTYQTRRLADGSAFEVLKNFPNQKEVEDLLVPMDLTIEWMDLKYYWILRIQ